MVLLRIEQFAIQKIWIFTRTLIHGSMVQTGMTHQAVADQFDVSRITISRLMIRLRQTGISGIFP
jgi:CRP-like cAMP-binding protein